ncbi:uncharacterized protein LOC134695038 isoform X1 [Mytilus trossulus]|uniref:uncharacterized protein LOC134695038 isoform X1 n=1 Tax=Mytilus trossulus TaxID=6551 RepID=UPI0030074449
MEKKSLKTNRQKTVIISTGRCESLNYYKYLCQIIGSKEDVKMRRLAFTITDMGKLMTFGYHSITSGSKGEGLDFKSSDFDIMLINSSFKVYESKTEVVLDPRKIPLVMYTEETQPCFTQLRLLNHHSKCNYFEYKLYTIGLNNIWEKNHIGCMLSSEQYKLFFLSISELFVSNIMKIHGPCLTDYKDLLDIAMCLKCNQWIIPAQPWIKRPRTAWPSAKIISKIISCGVLFVPIGNKGSINENLEWRISFSVAEKILIYSFSHTQFLCYALLKVFLKDVIEKHEDLKGLLCSYFLKTLLFWILEETEPNLWRPDNIIPCFMACLQRLLYCVRYSNLLHYFIPDNNFFHSRFDVMNKQKLETILENSYKQGIHCLASSKTLKHCERQSYNITQSLTSGYLRIVHQTYLYWPKLNYVELIHLLVHHSRTGLCRGLLALYSSKACWFAPNTSKYTRRYSSENKHQYSRYKHDLSHLLIGVQSDAVSGWLVLASFLYVHKKYFASLSVINHVLQKYTDKKIFTVNVAFAVSAVPRFTFIQKNELNLMKNEKLYTVLKTLTMDPLLFRRISSIIPEELQLDVTIKHAFLNPLPFAYFLNFLCYYHLQDFTWCRHYLQQLESCMTNSDIFAIFPDTSTVILVGIAEQLMGETFLARLCFQMADVADVHKITSAAKRLSSVI